MLDDLLTSCLGIGPSVTGAESTTKALTVGKLELLPLVALVNEALAFRDL